MKQIKTILQVQKLFPKVKGIDVALLYGSFARKEATPNSDIDIQILVNNEFENKLLIDELLNEFHSEIFSIREVSMRNKIVVYFNSQPKIEFAICTNIAEIDRNYLGSEILNFADTILYESHLSQYDIRNYLEQLVGDYNIGKSTKAYEKQVSDLLDKFVYEFESCSVMHRRSDGYQFYFFYNIALQLAIQLNHYSKGQSKFNFLPKNFITNILTKVEQKEFYSLKATLFLPEANQQKRRLLDFFYSSIESITTSEKQSELKHFCETIYRRDFLWNFRDISKYNPRIRSGLVFRTATMTLFQNENFFEDFISEKNIKTVIDLRAEREVSESGYTESSLNKFAWIHTPFDPWSQSIEFQANHHQGADIEIAYRFFTIECKHSIKNAIEAILKEQNSTAIHCYAGKDRTGIFISILHLLSGAELEIVYDDYLATEIDTKKEYLNIMLDIIEEKGGIEPYLIDCGLSSNQISQLKQKLFKK
jgi:predicted nucleotidyltransferase